MNSISASHCRKRSPLPQIHVQYRNVDDNVSCESLIPSRRLIRIILKGPPNCAPCTEYLFVGVDGEYICIYVGDTCAYVLYMNSYVVGGWR